MISWEVSSNIIDSLRALDGFVLQRALQILDPVPALMTKLGYAAPPLPPSGGAPLSISAHNLTPFQAVMWGMSIGAAAKQIFWMLYISKEEFNVKAALTVCAFNTVVNSLNTMAFSLASINPTWSETAFYVSIPFYAAGILIETVSEVQRKLFKNDPKNKGKIYSGGLFSYARHINFFGYMIWRGAFAMAGGGLVWGAIAAAFFWQSFHNNAIPVLDEYFTKRYGEQWQAMKRKVPYAFCPGIVSA